MTDLSKNNDEKKEVPIQAHDNLVALTNKDNYNVDPRQAPIPPQIPNQRQHDNLITSTHISDNQKYKLLNNQYNNYLTLVFNRDLINDINRLHPKSRIPEYYGIERNKFNIKHVIESIYLLSSCVDITDISKYIKLLVIKIKKYPKYVVNTIMYIIYAMTEIIHKKLKNQVLKSTPNTWYKIFTLNAITDIILEFALILRNKYIKYMELNNYEKIK